MRVYSTRILSGALAILLCCTPDLVFALSGQNPAQNAEGNASTQQQAPATSPIPDAPNPAENQTTQGASTSARPGTNQQNPQPEGTATARSARTLGGPASKPAGSAIAPAKQKQTRSLLIKLGAIAGAGLAIGTVYALTRGTPSRPPGAR
jgi:hypothetical protein